MVVTKQDLHQLIDEIPEQEHQAAAKYLQRLRDLVNDPIYKAFMNAPLDDEPVTPEERRLIDEAKAEVARGEVLSWEEAQGLLFGHEEK